MQFLRSHTLPTDGRILVVDTEAPGQPLKSGRPVHVLRVVRIPAGARYTGVRTRGAEVLHERTYSSVRPGAYAAAILAVGDAFDAAVSAAELQAVAA